MSEYSLYHYEFCAPRAWARPDATECGCRGSGWWSSQADVWYACSFHTGPHPEDYDDDDAPGPALPAPALPAPALPDDGLPF